MTQNPTIQNTQYLEIHLFRLQCIYKDFSQNKVTNSVNVIVTLINLKQMVRIRPQRSHHYILAFAPQWHQGSYSRVKTLLLSVFNQEVITCFTSSSIAITCQPGASGGFNER